MEDKKPKKTLESSEVTATGDDMEKFIQLEEKIKQTGKKISRILYPVWAVLASLAAVTICELARFSLLQNGTAAAIVMGLFILARLPKKD